MTTRKFFSLVPFFVVLVVGVQAQEPSNAVSPDLLRTHIRYLASDELEGRASGTEGNRKAADYIADLMEKYGLRPLGDRGSYFQPFEFIANVRLGHDNALTLEGSALPDGREKLKADQDFRPLGFSADTSVAGPLVFAGYGISAPEEKYDDYAGLDVSGKIIVVMRYTPDGVNPKSPLNKYASFRNKARTARDKGAAAILVITGPADDPEDVLVKLTYDNSFASSGIAAVSLKRSAIAPLLNAAGRDLAKIEDSIKATRTPIAFAFTGAKASLTTDVEKVAEETANIEGFLEGHDPVLKDQVIIVGAHMDHLGYGGPGSGSMQPDTVAIHHGADDNASGTAGLLELARLFGRQEKHLKHSLLFLSFSGEELGTLGSRYYVNHPRIPLERTLAMINMDMIGRLQNKDLTVYGTGTSPVWNPILAKEDADSTFTLKMIPDGYGPSDQEEFYAKDLPVLFFFTGMHFDYHKPSDEWQKINYDGEAKVVRFVEDIVEDLDAETAKPAFVRVATSAPVGGNEGLTFTVTLGIIPDYAAEGSTGLKISGIRPNGPAEKAGLKTGDTIVKMAGKKVMNIYDYMGVLGELKSGDVVEVEFVRDGRPMKCTATMQRRN